MIRASALLLVIGLAEILAVPAPRYLGSRPLGMGEAFIALADDYNGLFYNPAGLARLNSPMNAGIGMKLDLGDLFGMAGDAFDIFDMHGENMQSMEGMASDPTLVDDLMLYDREPIGFATLPEMHFAARSTDPDFPLGIGGAWFLHSQGVFTLDKGIYLPKGNAAVRTDLVFRVAAAADIWKGLSFGIAPIMATYSFVEQGIGFDEIQTVADTLNVKIDKEASRIYEPGFGFGVSMGLLYDIVPTELRVGAVVDNLFLKINDDPVPASYSLGIAYLPAIFRNQGMMRHVNLALDWRDIGSDRPILTNLNFGGEMDLTLARLRGGFKGGYPTFGLGLNLFIMQMEFTSWADERGLYAGQWEERHYLLSFRLGI